MFQIDRVGAPVIGYGTLDVGLSEEEIALQMTLERFAVEFMRPLAEKLDKMTPEEVVAEDSPIHEYFKKHEELGIGIDALASMEPGDMARMLPIVFDSLAYGDVGLALLPMVRKFPAVAAGQTGDPELIERFAGGIGCWIGTQPDRGSDAVDYDGALMPEGKSHPRGNLVARVTDDEVIIDGQTSSWVSGAPLADCALAYLPADYGDGVLNKETGVNYGAVILIPFDVPGVSKGKPLDKLGQRTLPQGEIFFDNVRLPRKYVIEGQDRFDASFFGALTFANMDMGLAFTGLARAAYDHALAYAHERKQGGVPIIQHQSVQYRLFTMWSKVEMCRAMSRRAVDYNFLSGTPHCLASATSKVTVTQMAYEVADEALQMFGGNGLTREYPLEKLYRDARAALIEDGENNVLGLKCGVWLSEHYLRRNA